MNTILLITLVAIAGICNAVMDKTKSHYSRSIFKDMNGFFWNPSTSWKNKWKNGDNKQGEKFFLSSTVLVFTTDAWHLFQFIMLKCLFLTVVMYSPMVNPVVDFVILHTVYSGTFELFFTYIFESKK